MKIVRIVNGAGLTVVERCSVADKPWSRMRGLLGRRELPAGEGILLRPAASVHMFFMAFAIDVVWLDRDLQVVGLTPPPTRRHSPFGQLAESHARKQSPGRLKGTTRRTSFLPWSGVHGGHRQRGRTVGRRPSGRWHSPLRRGRGRRAAGRSPSGAHLPRRACVCVGD